MPNQHPLTGLVNEQVLEGFNLPLSPMIAPPLFVPTTFAQLSNTLLHSTVKELDFLKQSQRSGDYLDTKVVVIYRGLMAEAMLQSSVMFIATE